MHQPEMTEIADQIDGHIRTYLGPSAIRIEEWYSDSDLNFNITYRYGSLDVDVWRDRGLYVVLVASARGAMFHHLGKIAGLVGVGTCSCGSVSYPHELSEQLNLISCMRSEIEELFEEEGMDEKLNELGSVRSICRKNA